MTARGLTAWGLTSTSSVMNHMNHDDIMEKDRWCKPLEDGNFSQFSILNICVILERQGKAIQSIKKYSMFSSFNNGGKSF